MQTNPLERAERELSRWKPVSTHEGTETGAEDGHDARTPIFRARCELCDLSWNPMYEDNEDFLEHHFCGPDEDAKHRVNNGGDGTIYPNHPPISRCCHEAPAGHAPDCPTNRPSYIEWVNDSSHPPISRPQPGTDRYASVYDVLGTDRYQLILSGKLTHLTLAQQRPYVILRRSIAYPGQSYEIARYEDEANAIERCAAERPFSATGWTTQIATDFPASIA